MVPTRHPEQQPPAKLPSRTGPGRVLRLLDAAANRATEGLRVIEDFLRFVLDDRHLTERCKELRHHLADLVGQVPALDRLGARDTPADVGTQISVPGETVRTDAWSVCAASFHRVRQALRSLEEYAKLIDTELAAGLEAIRYDAYTLEAAAGTSQNSVARLGNIRLNVLVDGSASNDAFTQKIHQLVEAGVHAIQLRDKTLDDRTLVERAGTLRVQTRGTPTLAIVNDRADVGLVAHADGVHLGQHDLSVAQARAILGPRAIVGVSTHHLQEARQAVLDGANLIGVGPTFPSRTKQFAAFTGLELLRRVCHEIRLPAFAIGGINHHNLAEVLTTGVHGVAVGAAIDQNPKPGVAAAAMLEALADTTASP